MLTSRDLSRTRESVEFYSGELAPFVNEGLRPRFRSIWFVGGGAVSGECLRLGLADEVRYSNLPILIGDGISFFEKLDRDVPLHLAEVKAQKDRHSGAAVSSSSQFERGRVSVQWAAASASVSLEGVHRRQVSSVVQNVEEYERTLLAGEGVAMI